MAANSAAHLLPHLHDSDWLLDIGAGPGTITAGLAASGRPGAGAARDG
jgi:precorrin-6B methylase 2